MQFQTIFLRQISFQVSSSQVKLLYIFCNCKMKVITKTQQTFKNPSTMSLKSVNYKANEANIYQMPKHRLKSSQSFCVQKSNILVSPKHHLVAIQEVFVKGKQGVVKKADQKTIFQPTCKQGNGQRKIKAKIQVGKKAQTPKNLQINKKELLNGLKNQMTKPSTIKPISNKNLVQIPTKLNNPQNPKTTTSFNLKSEITIQSPKSMKASLLHEKSGPRFSNYSQTNNRYGDLQKGIKGNTGIMQKSSVFQIQAPRSSKATFPILEKSKHLEQEKSYIKNQKFSIKSLANKSVRNEQPSYEFKFEKNLKKQRHYSSASEYQSQLFQMLPQFDSSKLKNSKMANFQSQSGVSQEKSLSRKMFLKHGQLNKLSLFSHLGQMKKSLYIESQADYKNQDFMSKGLLKVQSHPNLRQFFPKKSEIYEQSIPQFINQNKTVLKLKTQPTPFLKQQTQETIKKPSRKQKIELTFKNKQMPLKHEKKTKLNDYKVKNPIKSNATKKLQILVSKKPIQKSQKIQVQSRLINQNAMITGFAAPKSSQQNSFIENPSKGKISVSNKKQLLKNIFSKNGKGGYKEIKINKDDNPQFSKHFQQKAYYTPQSKNNSFKNCFDQNINLKLSLTVIEQRQQNSQNLQQSTETLQDKLKNKSIFAKKNQALIFQTTKQSKSRKYSQPIGTIEFQPHIKFQKSQQSQINNLQIIKNNSLSTLANSAKKSLINVSDFIRGPQIGRGKFGVVNIVRHRKTGCIFALKSIKKKVVNDEKIVDQIIRQIRIQYSLNHPNLVKLYAIFDDKDFLYLLLQYCPDGQLYKILQKKKKFSEIDTCFIMKELCDGISQLHKNNVIHRDIKPENVVISYGISKICDFGWSIQNDGNLRETLCGTPLYFSPELLTKGTYDQKADLWALGIMAFQMLTGTIPFEINSTSELMKIAKSQIHYPGSMSVTARDFVGNLLQRNPQMRVSIADVLKHKFFDIFQSQGQIGRSKSAVRLTTNQA